MFRIIRGLSVIFLSIIWFSFCVRCREFPDFDIRRTGRIGNYDYLSSSRMEKLERENFSDGKFPKWMNFSRAAWITRSPNNVIANTGRLFRPGFESLYDFRMISRDSRRDDLMSRSRRESRMGFSRDFRDKLFSEERALPNERSERRVYEKGMIFNQQTGDMSEFQEIRERSFEPRRTVRLSRNRESNREHGNRIYQRMAVTTRSDSFARERVSRSERLSADFSVYETVKEFIELWYSKIKESLFTLLLGFVFLFDFVNELIQVKKNADHKVGKSAVVPYTGTIARIFC